MDLPQIARYRNPFLPVYAAVALAAGVWLGERLHASAYLSCAGGQLAPHPARFLIPLPLLLVLAWWGRGRGYVLAPALMAAFLCLGLWRYAAHPFEPCLSPEHLAAYHSPTPFGAPRVLEGVIVGYPDRRATYVQYRVQVDGLWQGSALRQVEGVALVRTSLAPAFQYGDRVRIRGVPTAPPVFPGFDYRRFLARKGIHTMVSRAEVSLMDSGHGHPFWAALYGFRGQASAILDQLMPQPYAALASGMILGIEGGIPRELYEEFNLTGTSHVIVISGSNIAIISGVLLGLFSRGLGRRKRAVTGLTISGIVLYTLLVGADAAVTRAALMGILYVLALHLGRQSTALISLFLAAAVMMLLNPLTLWDVGFQLSFTATLGLILFSPLLRARWDARIGKRLPKAANAVLAEGLLVTVAAQIATIPLVIVYFGRLSLVSFVANMLIVPVQPPIMMAGGLAALVGFLSMPLAKLIALAPYASLWWTVAVVQTGVLAPWASLEISAFGRLLAILYMLALALGFAWWLARQTQGGKTLIPDAWRPGLQRSVTLAALVILPAWTGATWLESQPDGRLHLHLLGQQQGAAWLLVTPGGNRILLDPDRQAQGAALEEILRGMPGGKRPVDLVIYTRPQTGEGGDSGANSLAPGHPALVPGAVLALDGGVSLTLVHTPQEANDSLLFLLRHGEFTTLLPFENSQEAQMQFLDRLPQHLTVLVAPYAGTGAWPHLAALERLQPQAILAPQGTTYPPGVQQALARQPGLISIPHDAAVELTSDGVTYSLRSRAYSQDWVHR